MIIKKMDQDIPLATGSRPQQTPSLPSAVEGSALVINEWRAPSCVYAPSASLLLPCSFIPQSLPPLAGDCNLSSQTPEWGRDYVQCIGCTVFRKLGDGGEVGEELHRALAGDEVVVHDAADGEHGKAAVLHLLELHRLQVRLAEPCSQKKLPHGHPPTYPHQHIPVVFETARTVSRLKRKKEEEKERDGGLVVQLFLGEGGGGIGEKRVGGGE